MLLIIITAKGQVPGAIRYEDVCFVASVGSLDNKKLFGLTKEASEKIFSNFSNEILQCPI
jgi:hypothetical protein